MTLIDRNTNIPFRSEIGLVPADLIADTRSWVSTRLATFRQKLRRKTELDSLLKLRDRQLRDIGAERGALQDERDRLDWAAHDAAQSDVQNRWEISQRFLRR